MGLMGGAATAVAIITLLIRSWGTAGDGDDDVRVVAVVAVRLRDVLGTRLYDNLGGFQTCVVAITIVYALICRLFLPVPRTVTATADGEIGDSGARGRLTAGAVGV